MMARITYNGFHGYRDLRFHIPGDWPTRAESNEVEVSERVGRRLNRAVCPCSDCTCGEGVARQDGTHWWVSLPFENGGVVRGEYPQQT